jgi:hypothetical protein
MHSYPPTIMQLPTSRPAIAITVSTPAHPHIGPGVVLTDVVERTYTVKSGDTLSAIAQKYYSDAADWTVIYWANDHIIGADPNLIIPGQHLSVPALPTRIPGPPAGFRADPVPTTTHAAVTDPPAGVTLTAEGGTLSYGGLEALWEDAGGSAAYAADAACIAHAESGGNQFATGGVGEEGYWQINPVNDGRVANGYTVEASYSPVVNAKDAIAISDDGRTWAEWTTAGMCGL